MKSATKVHSRLVPGILLVALLMGGGSPRAAPLHAVQAPILKWQHGGCTSWCETGWYSSPAVADLDGDGTMEVIGAAYTLFVLNGEDGSLQWSVDTPDSRVWPGVVVADVDDNGDLEIVVAQGSGYVSVYDHQGNSEPGWPQRPASNEFRSLAVADLDGDGDMEIVVGLARLDRVNAWVFEHTGSIRAGWPQLSNDEGSAAGLYNDNIGLGDLDGDGILELVIPADTITICAYEPDGSHLPTHEMYHGHPGHDMDHWGEVPAYVDLEYETRGWGPCYTESAARANFANGPANIVDVNGDGVTEVVVIGDVHDCNTVPYTDLYNGPYIFDADLELVLNTAHSGLVAYDLPGTADARILWGTGRGNYQRTGSLLQGTLQGTLQESTKSIYPILPGPGDTLTYTITLRNPGPALPGVRVTDTLPAQVHYLGNLWASTGSYGEAGGVITWTGTVPAVVPLTITFGVTISEQITTPQAISNTALIDDGLGNVWSRQAVVIANGYALHLPLILRHYGP